MVEEVREGNTVGTNLTCLQMKGGEEWQEQREGQGSLGRVMEEAREGNTVEKVRGVSAGEREGKSSGRKERVRAATDKLWDKAVEVIQFLINF